MEMGSSILGVEDFGVAPYWSVNKEEQDDNIDAEVDGSDVDSSDVEEKVDDEENLDLVFDSVLNKDPYSTTGVVGKRAQALSNQRLRELYANVSVRTTYVFWRERRQIHY
jgi:hypothetical protein